MLQWGSVCGRERERIAELPFDLCVCVRERKVCFDGPEEERKYSRTVLRWSGGKGEKE